MPRCACFATLSLLYESLQRKLRLTVYRWLYVAARALCQNFLSDLDAPFAARRSLRATIERYEALELVFYDTYDRKLSNAVLKSPFYCISGVESVEGLSFQHSKSLKIL